jgi:hypothetical protein
MPTYFLGKYVGKGVSKQISHQEKFLEVMGSDGHLDLTAILLSSM